MFFCCSNCNREEAVEVEGEPIIQKLRESTTEKMPQDAAAITKSAAPPLASTSFVVRVSKSSQRLGIDIKHHNQGQSILVVAVKAGMVEDWNNANPDQAIRQGDVITAVNGVCGSSVRILEAIAASGDVLEMSVTRIAA
eukprot:TRINITY_DN864_c1_g1_i1.p1 TRINITY_DN864_c1_g1~~TRINITY_DN864_c1_g1_i1.p1  ORF type:complete len:163 (+),score=32.19 TRINITY_DN864_c1_g1_i1:73-489(+)